MVEGHLPSGTQRVVQRIDAEGLHIAVKQTTVYIVIDIVANELGVFTIFRLVIDLHVLDELARAWAPVKEGVTTVDIKYDGLVVALLVSCELLEPWRDEAVDHMLT